MASTLRVTLYLGTGYNSKNIPEHPSLLNGTESVEIENIARAGLGLPSIRIHASYDVVSRADYARIIFEGHTYYYFVTGFNYVSAGAIDLGIELDALTTSGALTDGTINGTVTRRIKTKEECGDYKKAVKLTLNEPFTPSLEPVKESHHNIIGGTSGSHIHAVSSTVDLRELKYEAKDYIDPESKNYVTVPNIPPMNEPTGFSISGGNLGSASLNPARIPGVSLFDGTEKDVKTSISIARSLGIESAITDSYNIPKKYVTWLTGGASTGFINELNSTVKETSVSIDTVPVDVENKKAALLHAHVTLMSVVSGEGQDYSLAQINGDLTFKYFADPTPQGRPYCRPKSVQGDENLMYGAVGGAEWFKQPLGFTMRSGQEVMRHAYNRQAKMSSRSAAQNIVGSAIGVAMGIAGLGDLKMTKSQGMSAGEIAKDMGQGAPQYGGQATAASGAMVSGLNSFDSLRSASMAFDEQSNLVPPEIAFAVSPGMQNYIGNDFSVIYERLSNEDIRRFDEFLHNYGESVDEVFDYSMLKTRKNFNYIQFGQVDIISTYPRYVVDKAITQLQNGVRVWHTTPSSRYLKVGGN